MKIREKIRKKFGYGREMCYNQQIWVKKEEVQ